LLHAFILASCIWINNSVLLRPETTENKVGHETFNIAYLEIRNK